MKRIMLFITILFQFGFSQDMPAQPQIAWMDTDYTIEDSTVLVSLTWDIWWGENGDHWRLLSNTESLFEALLVSDTPNAQNGSYNIEYALTGEYSLVVQLCNGEGVDELCNSSNAISISVSASDGGGNLSLIHI